MCAYGNTATLVTFAAGKDDTVSCKQNQWLKELGEQINDASALLLLLRRISFNKHFKNGPFARSGHMVRNKLHWDANYAVGFPK